MSQLATPAKINRGEIIRTVQEVVNTNAALIIVDATVDNDTGIATFVTDGGDEITLDLSGAFISRDEYAEGESVTPATESKAGIIKLSTEALAKALEDDTTALTPAKLGAVLSFLNIPTFEFDEEKTGQILSLRVDANGKVVITNAEGAAANPTLDALALKADLQSETYASPGAAVVTVTPQGRVIRYMAWARMAAYIAVNITSEYLGIFFDRAKEFWTLDKVLGNNGSSDKNITLLGPANLLHLQRDTDQAADRYNYFSKQLPDKTIEYRAAIGMNSNGNIAIALGKTLDLTAEFRKDITLLNAGFVQMAGIAQANEYRQTSIKAPDQEIVGQLVVQKNSLTGFWDQRVLPIGALGGGSVDFDAVMPLIAQWIRSDFDMTLNGQPVAKPTFPKITPTTPSIPPVFTDVHYSEGVVVKSRYITSLNFDLPEAGGWIGVLQDVLGDGSERQSPSVVTYSIVDKPDYITISQPGDLTRAHVKLVLAPNSISENKYVLLQASVGGNVVAQQRIRLINSDTATCTRPGGLQTFTFAFNFVAQGATTATPLTWDNSDAIAVNLYNGSKPGRWGQDDLYVQVESLTVGKSVFPGLTTSCDKIDRNVFYVRDANAGNTINKIVETDIQGTIVRIKTPAVALAVDFVGTVDNADCAGTDGWGINRNAPGAELDIELATGGTLNGNKHTGGTVVGTAKTNIDSPDIAANVNPAATKARWGIFLPDALKNGTNVVHFREKTTGTILNGSPKTITCGVVAKNYSARVTARIAEGATGQARLYETINGQEQISTDGRTYRLGAGTPAGIFIDATGLVTVGVGSISVDSSIYVFIKPAGADEVFAVFTAVHKAANRAPVLKDAMPDVPITSAGEYRFALPDQQFEDPDGDALTTTITQADGSALPAWLSYDSSKRTFTKADGFTSGSIDLLVTATDPGGLTATDTFTVSVNADAVLTTPRITRVDVEFIRNASTGNKLRIWTKVVGETNGVTTQFNTAADQTNRIIGNQPAVTQSDGFTHYKEYPAVDGVSNTAMVGQYYFKLGPIKTDGSINTPGVAEFPYTIPASGSAARTTVLIGS